MRGWCCCFFTRRLGKLDASWTDMCLPCRGNNTRVRGPKLQRNLSGVTQFTPTHITYLRRIVQVNTHASCVQTRSSAPACHEKNTRKRATRPVVGAILGSKLDIMPHATSLPATGFQAVILCGPGASFSTFTSTPKDIPKALLPIANRPMVWYPLEWCYRMGVTGEISF